MENRKGTLIMLCGLPASGKSYYAEKLEDVQVVSTDRIREQLYGDASNQSDPQKVFEHAYKLANTLLSEGHTVVFDATNINRRRRIHAIKNVLKAERYEVHYMVVPIEDVMRRNFSRERVVPVSVITRMYHNMQVPVKGEGWDKVKYIINRDKSTQYPIDFMDHKVKSIALKSLVGLDMHLSHKVLFTTLGSLIHEFSMIHDLPHDSSYHTLTVSEHTHKVYELTREKLNARMELNRSGEKNNSEIYRAETLMWASLFHDIGKGETKSFYNHKGVRRATASFIGHENVSAQLALLHMTYYDFNLDLIEDVVALVQFHMYPMKASEKRMRQIEKLLGSELYTMLMDLHDSDKRAK